MQDSYRVEFGDSNQGFQIGVNYGPIHLPPGKFNDRFKHATTELSGHEETPPSPLSTVPFRRDQDFVERGDLLGRIQQKCAVPGSWTALVGLGGVG